MKVLIGVDPHKGSHTAVAIDHDEIEGERTVIIEEIRGYQDDPSEYAQMLFHQAMFGDGPLGRAKPAP